MSDVKTAPKSATKDVPTAKPEKTVDPSANPSRGQSDPSTGPQGEFDRPDLIAAEAEATESARRWNDAAQETKRQADVRMTELPLLENTLQLATRNVETLITSTNVAVRAAEDVAQTAVEYGQRNFEQLSALVRRLADVRSLSELITVQREHTHAVVENLLDETSRLTQQLSRRFGDIVDTAAKQETGTASAVRRRAA
jgi:hypothetical protein